MKQYSSPNIKAVTLDPEQAILEICQVAGAYMLPGNLCYSLGGGAPCAIAVRGVQLAIRTRPPETSASPS
ncbi:MAG: hypothetical protein PHQ52_01840 [Candidatus Omnitrophica bacterium]|nr:hypothetical protein [Candidatus Omnitrophota bacterium]